MLIRTTPYAAQQSDQALKTAIAFLQARQAGEISYGRNGRSAGCVITHPSFRQRWLKAKWWPAGELQRFLWDGELLSIGFEEIKKPRLFGYFDWEALGICYRAIMMSVAPPLVSKMPYPEREPVLEPQWWDQLKNAIAAIQAKQTDRIHITEEGMARRLSERFGLKLKLPFPLWQTAHGDCHWGNLTAPEFSLIDWETWGRAPYGFDVALLHVYSMAQPELVATLKGMFPSIMAPPEYDIVYLLAASEVMRVFDIHGHYPLVQADLRREVERVLAQRRFALFCE
jgi:hypothetical protein